MTSQVTRLTVFATYQFSILLGILLMPVALVAHRMGVALPINRLIDRTGGAYERVAETESER